MSRLALPTFARELDWAMTSVMAATAFVLVGICAVTVGLMHAPLEAEFHWSNSAVSGLATAYSLTSLLSGPFAGALIDRFGSRQMLLAGTLIAALGFLGLGFASAMLHFYLMFGLVGIGYGGAFYLASLKVIATGSGEHKNIAMGIWMFAGSTGAACFSYGVSWSIREYGWRATAFAASGLIFCTLPAIIAFVAPDRVDQEPLGSPTRTSPARPATGLFMSPLFLLMTAASMFAAFGMSAIYFHIVPIFVSAGFTESSASTILGASWVLSAVGSLFCGALPQRISTRAILAGSLLFGAVGTFALLLAPTERFGVVAVYGFVLLWGATANAINQFLPLLLVESFGSAHMGILVGVQGALMGLVGSCAPMVTGALYDQYSSYQVSILASAVATSMALLFVAGMRRRPGAAVSARAAQH